jgi:hypothetical protein
MKRIIKRLKAEETRIGKIFAYYIPILLGSTATIVEILEQLQTMPFEVPFDVKKVIGICTLIGFVYGKFTKKQDGNVKKLVISFNNFGNSYFYY